MPNIFYLISKSRNLVILEPYFYFPFIFFSNIHMPIIIEVQIRREMHCPDYTTFYIEYIVYYMTEDKVIYDTHTHHMLHGVRIL